MNGWSMMNSLGSSPTLVSTLPSTLVVEEATEPSSFTSIVVFWRVFVILNSFLAKYIHMTNSLQNIKDVLYAIICLLTFYIIFKGTNND